MKVLLVNGSPHKNGCTYTALSEAAKTLNEENIETEIFWIGNKAISGCMGCKGCVQKGKCVFDDCVNEFVEKAAEADGERAGPDSWRGQHEGHHFHHRGHRHRTV